MGAGPTTVVPSPPAAAPRVGLLVSANTPPDENGRWQGGITYDPETGHEGYTTSECAPGENDRDLGDPPGTVEWEPYIVGAGFRCTALAASRVDWRAKARRLLEAQAEFEISQELWTGAISQAHSLGNPRLNSGGEQITTGNVDPRAALALLEQYLAEQGGQRGMIHAPRTLVSQWAQDGGIRRDGGLILTIHDTIVVPGAGYPSEERAHATGMIDVRRGPVDLFGDPEGRGGGVDRDVNTIEVRAEQIALASWDGIVHGTVEVNL